MQSEFFNSLTQVLLFLLSAFAAIFLFFYNNKFGQLSRNFSVFINIERINIDGEKDWLCVKVRIKRNNVGVVEIHDAQIKAKWDIGEVIRPLEGINRLAIIKRKSGDISIDWDGKSPDKYLRFAAEEEAEFSTWLEVPKDKVVVIEFAMVAPSFKSIDQWRASSVSLPLK